MGVAAGSFYLAAGGRSPPGKERLELSSKQAWASPLWQRQCETQSFPLAWSPVLLLQKLFKTVLSTPYKSSFLKDAVLPRSSSSSSGHHRTPLGKSPSLTTQAAPTTLFPVTGRCGLQFSVQSLLGMDRLLFCLVSAPSGAAANVHAEGASWKCCF